MAMIKIHQRSVLPGNPYNISDNVAARNLCQRIQIAIPYTNHLDPKVTEWALKWKMAGCSFAPMKNKPGFLEITRAHIVYEFLRTTHEFLILMDSDVMPVQAEAPLVLASHNLPVVAAVVPIWHPDAGLCANFQIDHNGQLMWPVAKAGAKIPSSGLAKVAWAGTGLICIHRKILEDIISSGETPFFIPEELRKKAAVTGLLHTTEDKAFSEQVQKVGADVFVDFGIHGTHDKTERFRFPEDNIEPPANAGRMGQVIISENAE